MKRLQEELSVIKTLRESTTLTACFDFDGTLVPIADTPDHIVVPSDVPGLLSALAATPGRTVGIVTGRSISDISAYLRVPPAIRIAGNHGLEWMIDGTYATVPLPAAYLPALQTLAGRLRELSLRIPGLVIEWKELTLSCHLRSVPPDAMDQARTDVLQMIREAGQDGVFSVIGGLRDIDVRPALSWTKADVIRHFMGDRLGSGSTLLYIGDDTTDEDVFRSFPQAVTVHVGRNPDSRASYFVLDTSEVLNILRLLAGN